MSVLRGVLMAAVILLILALVAEIDFFLHDIGWLTGTDFPAAGREI